MAASYLEMHRKTGRTEGRVYGSEVEQGAMESGKWVFTVQFFLLFCVFLKFHDKIVEKKLNGPIQHGLLLSPLPSSPNLTAGNIWFFPRSINLISKPLERLFKEYATDSAIPKGEFLVLL